MNKVSKEVLYELYVIRGKPMHEIASILHIGVGTVYNYMKNMAYSPETQKKCLTTLKSRDGNIHNLPEKRVVKHIKTK